MHGMGLGVKDKQVVTVSLDLKLVILGKDKVQVLEGLGEPEALHLGVEAAAVLGHDVCDAGEAARVDAQGAVKGLEGVPGEVLPLGVAGDAVGVVDALEGLGPQDVGAGRGPEARRLVKVGVLGRRQRVQAGAVLLGAVDPAEALGADARGRLAVELEAGLGELEAKLGVLGFLEGDAAEDEVAAVEAVDFYLLAALNCHKEGGS